jgi:hypothetical protein
MAISVHSIQVAETQSKTAQSVQPPKTLQTQDTSENKGSRDVVTISQEARQALASNTKQASGADANLTGENH